MESFEEDSQLLRELTLEESLQPIAEANAGQRSYKDEKLLEFDNIKQREQRIENNDVKFYLHQLTKVERYYLDHYFFDDFRLFDYNITEYD